MSEDNNDDWPTRWRKMMPFGPWSFPDIEEMMKEMEKEFMQFKDIEKQVPKDLIREQKSTDGSVKREIGPIVYGYSMTIGPDGKPVIREFGNVKRSNEPLKGVSDKREPLVDVVDSEKQVRIIAEIPGVRKEDIDMEVEGRTLSIKVDTESRKYAKELQLPETAVVDSAKSSYNNGILEVTFDKRQQDRSGVRIKIE
jgi:HSP20 family protein